MNNSDIKPIIITDNETGEKYTLEFTKESVKFAQLRGFDINEVDTKPMIAIPDLFFYAFRAHHMNVPREKVEKLLWNKLKGLSGPVLERLIQLFLLPYTELISTDETEGDEKNALATVEL